MKLIFGILCDSSICGNSYSDICLYRWQSYYDLFSYNVENTYSYMPLSFALNPRRKGQLRTYYLNEQTGQLEDQSDLPNVQDSECDAHGTQKTLCDDEVRSDTAVNWKYFYVRTYIQWRYLPYRARAECVPAGECYDPTIQGTTCN